MIKEHYGLCFESLYVEAVNDQVRNREFGCLERISLIQFGYVALVVEAIFHVLHYFVIGSLKRKTKVLFFMFSFSRCLLMILCYWVT